MPDDSFHSFLVKNKGFLFKLINIFIMQKGSLMNTKKFSLRNLTALEPEFKNFFALSSCDKLFGPITIRKNFQNIIYT